MANKDKDSNRRMRMTDKEIDRHYYQVKAADEKPSFTITPMKAELYKPKNKGQK